jgi:hypothetical protein
MSGLDLLCRKDTRTATPFYQQYEITATDHGVIGEGVLFFSIKQRVSMICDKVDYELVFNVFFHSPSKVYHVTIMPCYDKKLEASRQDFYNDIYRTRDVDCVLTTGEIESMLQDKEFLSFTAIPMDVLYVIRDYVSLSMYVLIL